MKSTKITSNSAFTIVELIVVIVIIGILAAITIVSYTGITQKANVAAMQSDLSNSAKKLNLYQVADPSNNYPADQAAAIAANVIKPNTNMDYIYYGVDNTSNPKYYCYMYRKGTDTWAVDSNSQPSKGVCLQNLIENGNFSVDSNSDGLADGWTVAAAATKSLSANIQTYTAGAQFSSLGNSTLPTYISGNIYYTSAYVDVASTGIALIIYQGAGGGWPASAHSASPGFQLISVRASVVTGSSVNIYIQDSRISGFTPIRVKQWGAVNLTSIFGSGNEPTQAQTDALMSQLPNSWFNITAKVNL